jgi:4a-hydroxytetrahydrobiopterin dehydratase
VPAAARLVHAIGELAGLADQHPDVDLRYGGVTVRLITMTHDYCGLSEQAAAAVLHADGARR